MSGWKLTQRTNAARRVWHTWSQDSLLQSTTRKQYHSQKAYSLTNADKDFEVNSAFLYHYLSHSRISPRQTSKTRHILQSSSTQRTSNTCSTSNYRQIIRDLTIGGNGGTFEPIKLTNIPISTRVSIDNFDINWI